MKKHLPTLIFLLLASTFIFAGPIKTWASSDVLTSTDLNQAFQHIHNSMVGGHGARLVDADVAANAAIQQSKISGLSTTSAKCWGRVSPYLVDGGFACTTTPCYMPSSGPASAAPTVTRTATGTYTISCTNLTSSGLVIATGNDKDFPGAYNTGIRCQTIGGQGHAGIYNEVDCRLNLDGTATDAEFNFMAFDQ